MSCARTVAGDFFSRSEAEIRGDRFIVVQLRTPLRLRAGGGSLESRFRAMIRAPKIVNTSPVRITQTINGRTYVIEVRPVGDRWRAQVVQRPGGMTSLMPFYGTTPNDAAGMLAGWLARASEPRKAV